MNIGRLTIPNRIVMTAMGTNFAKPGGGISDELIAFYEARARGGVGLIISEITRIDEGPGVGEPSQMSAVRPSDIQDLQRLTDTIHKYETKFFVQLQHPGREASSFVSDAQPVAPSPLPNPMGGEMPRELSEKECETLIEKFAQGAWIASQAGADGVELHAAHGYLINEFLSSAMNERTDKFGGSFENRMRFLTDIITAIRHRCGPSFPLSVRINAEEMLEGGIDHAEAQKIACALEAAGVDALNVSCYTSGCVEPGTYEQGWKEYMADLIKQVVAIPVIAVNNVKEPRIAEKMLADGACDFVGVARGHLADPAWCSKAFSGREAEIRPCIGCLACFGEIAQLKRLKCAVNPTCGREREYATMKKDGAGRTVAVIGGGPAGIEAASVLNARGFKPVIFDDGTRLGGTLNVAEMGYGKKNLARYVDYLNTLIRTIDISVRLNTTATVEMVQDLQPYGVFIACGAKPFIPSVPGIDDSCVCIAEDVLKGSEDPQGKVVVVGSGMTGLETAESLAECGCELTIVEMLDTVGPGIQPFVLADVMSRVGSCGPHILTGHALQKVEGDKAYLTCLADGSTVIVESDAIVLAAGVRPRSDVAETFSAAFENVRIVGDASKGGRILEATQDGYGKAFVFAG